MVAQMLGETLEQFNIFLRLFGICRCESDVETCLRAGWTGPATKSRRTTAGKLTGSLAEFPCTNHSYPPTPRLRRTGQHSPLLAWAGSRPRSRCGNRPWRSGEGEFADLRVPRTTRCYVVLVRVPEADAIGIN